MNLSIRVWRWRFPGQGAVELARTAKQKEVKALQWIVSMCIQPNEALIT
jgi:hypothetical protein